MEDIPISASVAASAGSAANPFESAGTNIIFGNAEGLDADNAPTYDAPTSATAVASQGGPASASAPIGIGGSTAAPAVAGSSGLTTTQIVLLGIAAFAAYHFLAHKKI